MAVPGVWGKAFGENNEDFRGNAPLARLLTCLLEETLARLASTLVDAIKNPRR